MPNDKIDSLTLPNGSGTNVTYDIDLPADAAPSIASLTVSGNVQVGGNLTDGSASISVADLGNVKTSDTLTNNKIILGAGNSGIKISSNEIGTSSTTWDSSSDVYVPTMKAIEDEGFVKSSGVTSVRVQATAPVQSSQNTEQTSSLNTTISLADAYGDTKNPYGVKAKNKVLAGPDGSSGHTADAAPEFRALVAADIPNLSASKITSDTFNIARIPTGTSHDTVAYGDHGHGNITTDGKITATAVTSNQAGIVVVGSDGTINKMTDAASARTLIGALASTTTYAGSSTIGGSATSAEKLNNSTDAGSATQPVYFVNGVPAATTYALNKTVPSDAVFTDTTYGADKGISLTNDKYGHSNTYTAQSTQAIYPITVDTYGHVASIGTAVTLGTAAAKDFTTSVTSGSADLVTSGAVYTAISKIPSKPMVFKGGVGHGSTVETLPAADETNEGWVYVVTVAGTYASQAAQVGDIFVSNGQAWILVPSGDEPGGTVTSVSAGTGLTTSFPSGSSSSAGDPITTEGTILLATAYGDSKNPYGSKTANYVLAAPNGSNGTPSFRALVKADIPLASETAASGGTTTSLVTTGEKYTWNNKATGSISTDANNVTTITINSNSANVVTTDTNQTITGTKTLKTTNSDNAKQQLTTANGEISISGGYTNPTGTNAGNKLKLVGSNGNTNISIDTKGQIDAGVLSGASGGFSTKLQLPTNSSTDRKVLATLEDITGFPYYSASNTYQVGDTVIYNEKAYKCTTAITTAEAWDPTHWVICDLTSYQPLDADLTAIAGIGDNSTGFLQKTAANTWSLATPANDDHYPTTFTWTDGSTAGPTGSLTGNTGFTAVSFPAIPVAGTGQSGVITVGSQTLMGTKTFVDSVFYSQSSAISGSGLVVRDSSAATTTSISSDSVHVNAAGGTIKLSKGTSGQSSYQYFTIGYDTDSKYRVVVKDGDNNDYRTIYFPKTSGRLSTIADISSNQATMSVVGNAVTNINGRSFEHYTATGPTTVGNYTFYQILKDGNTPTEDEAKEYMKYMTGSSFLPIYNYDFPKQTIFMFADRSTWKPQYSTIDGLRLYRLSTPSALVSDITITEATDNILDATITNKSLKYAPYTTKAAGHLYKHSDAPSDTTEYVKFDGKFYATEVYAGTTKLTGNTGTVTSITVNTNGTGLSGGSATAATTTGSWTIALDSSAEGNRAANKVVIAKANGQINSEKLAITSSGTAKATMQYNTIDDCIEFIFA